MATLSYACVLTRDIERLAAFYREVLGVDAIGSEDYVQLHSDGTGLALSSKRSVDIFHAGAAEAKANRSVVLDFEVADVDQQYCRLRTVVSHFVLQPTNQPWGCRSMLFRDPDGNLINFFSHLTSFEARLLRSKRTYLI